MDFLVRRATLDDVDELVRLRLAFTSDVNRESPPDGFADATRAFLDEELDGSFVTFVAEADGELIGAGSVSVSRSLPLRSVPTGRHGYVLNMYTVPAWRARGVARAVLRAIVAHAREARVERLWLLATDEGRPLYQQEGFAAPGDYMRLDLYAGGSW